MLSKIALQLSADPSADVSATFTAHIIPRVRPTEYFIRCSESQLKFQVDFGIDLFGGVGQASVSLPNVSPPVRD